MTESAPQEDASPPGPVAKTAASRWAKLWGQLKRFRWPIAVAAVVVLALVALALVQLPTVWQTIVTIAGVGAVLSGLAGYWNTYHIVKKSVPLPASTKAPVAASALSVIVLPFQNLTGDANQAYVADGLTASLTSDLSRIRDAFIVNAATAFAYKDKPVTAQQIGKDLGVRFVLHGSVQRSGIKIRINAQLADATTNAQLWSERFEGDQSDLFALQDRVTTLVGNSIGREMVIVAARESESRKSSPRVADLLLRASALDLKPLSLTNLQQAEDLYRQVLAQEPNNVSAMVGLAGSLLFQPGNFASQMDESVKEKKYSEGRDLALKAKEIDPDNPGIYGPIAIYAGAHGDFAGARRAYETLLSLAPKNPRAYTSLAYSFLVGGEPKRAIELLNQAINLRPKHPNEFVLFLMGYAYFMLGDNDAAIEWCLRSQEKNPIWPQETYACLAMAYALKGEDAKARAAAADYHRLDPNEPLSAWRKRASSRPAAYKEYFENKLVPAWRKAGLPE
jgi:adenylate cyclase